uniref:Protein kinase domain-containing protein n=1 Tax=Nothobranchius furzeri TaxID=105023 RepID=A0A8C6MFI2_NOTFU
MTTAKIQRGAIFLSKTNKYIVESISYVDNNFAVLASCRKCQNNEILDLKCIHRKYLHKYKQEANVLFYLKQHFPKEDKFVKILEMFHYGDWFCFALERSNLKLSEIVESRTSKRLGIKCIKVIAHRMLSVLDIYLIFYELLDQDLCDFMAKRINKPLKMGEVRCIAKQLLVSLRELKHIHVTHLDIKPNNILLVNHSLWPFKLIGFGSAHETGTSTNITKVQTVGYRAPEVHMGLPFDESIDIWGLGCTLVFLYLAKHLFPEDEYSVMRLIVKCCGMPAKEAIQRGKHSHRFFVLRKNVLDLESLAEQEDLKDFVNLVKRMIVLKPSDRIRPDEALKHPFILRGQYPNTSSHPSVLKACETPALSYHTTPDEENTNHDLTDSSDALEASTLQLKKGVKIFDESKAYIVEEVIGPESFGGVVRCRDTETDDVVEIKIFRREYHLNSIKKVNECSNLSNLDPSKKETITFIDCFIYKDCLCLVFDPAK